MNPLSIVLTTLCVAIATLPAAAQQTATTDGPEESEYGSGGYPFGGPDGRFYISPAFGSGILNQKIAGNQSGLLYGVDLGWERDGWIGIQGGYTYISDLKMSIYSLGSRFAYNADPFVYYITTQAGFYSPKLGDSNFGLAPGAGVDIIVNNTIRIGLNYNHDFIFTDNTTTDLNRVYAGLKFYF